MADRNSVFLGIGIGCLVVILGITALVGGCTVWMYRQAQRIESEMEDPATRNERVLEILGTDELPAGYHPLAAFSIPLVLRTAILTDRPFEGSEPPRGEAFDERGFIFVETLGFGQDEAALRDYFEGRTDDAAVLEDNGFDFEIDEVISRGTLPPAGDVRFLYVAQRADISLQGFRGDGLSALVLVDCPQDEKRRVAIWFGPDAPLPAAGAEPDYSGTPADPEAISGFLGNFTFCR